MENHLSPFALSCIFFFLFNSIALCLGAAVNLNFTTDKHALLSFRNSITSDPGSILHTKWSENTSVCNWIGVTCGIKHQRVTALNLSGFDLAGTVAPHLGNLTFLRYLDISSNNFMGFLPSELSKLQRLKVMNVGMNSFTGEIPTWFDSLLELEQVYLKNNSFSGTIPPSLFNSSKIQTLEMGFNLLSGSIPRGIFNMSSMKVLRIRDNSLSGPLPNDMCNNMPNINTLSLSSNQLSGKIPPNIWKCRNLEILSLSVNNFTGIPSEIESLSMLRELYLGKNDFRGGIPPQIGNLSTLEILDIRSASLSGKIPSSIFNISSLRVLVLVGNSLSGSIPTFGNSLPQLQLLFLGYNHMTDVAAALEYLHHGYSFPVVHCDVKPSNVLLDATMVAHLSDFGISKLFESGEAFIQTQTLATIGYAAPEYGTEGQVSMQGDVYSFGIMMLEMFTGKKPTNDMFGGTMSLKDWVVEALQHNTTIEIVAASLLSREDQHFSAKERCVSSIFELAMKCVADSADERINMIEAAATLHKIYTTTVAALGSRRPRYALSIAIGENGN